MEAMPKHDPVPHRSVRASAPDPDDGRRVIAWRRYKALMSWMAVAAVVAALIAVAYLVVSGVALTIHMVIATIAGVGFSVLLGTALMGLVYFSSNSGHDDGVDGRSNSDRNKH